MLLSWQHSGFHDHAGEPVLPEDVDRLEHLAFYATRAPIRLYAITPLGGARVVMRTSPDPQTGSQRLELDVLEMIRRLYAQISAPRQHLVRYYGWYAHRARGVRGEDAAIETSSAPSTPRSRSWTRLLRKIFEVDPLLCPQCLNLNPVEMRPVSVIQKPTVIDRILGHLQKIGGNDLHEGTAQRGPRWDEARSSKFAASRRTCERVGVGGGFGVEQRAGSGPDKGALAISRAERSASIRSGVAVV